MHPERFRFSIDRGGTFTDVYAEVPGETGYRVVKLLSEDPDNYEDAPREGIRRILEDVTGQPFDPKGFDSGLICLLYTSPSPRDLSTSRMPSSA